jgi:hypothetical protein
MTGADTDETSPNLGDIPLKRVTSEQGPVTDEVTNGECNCAEAMYCHQSVPSAPIMNPTYRLRLAHHLCRISRDLLHAVSLFSILA